MSEQENGNGNEPKELTGNNGQNNGELTGQAKSLLNLRPWPKGVSGNPSGRPKKPITEAYKAYAERKYPGDAEGRTYAERVAAGIFDAAICGQTPAAKELADRLEGPVNRDVAETGGVPIIIQINFEASK